MRSVERISVFGGILAAIAAMALAVLWQPTAQATSEIQPLTALSVSTGTLSPAFSSGTY